MHITVIQAVLCNTNPIITRLVCKEDEDSKRQMYINDVMKFINDVEPRPEDPDIFAYVCMFVGAVYKNQSLISTLDDEKLSLLFVSCHPCSQDIGTTTR